tara:strand:+ start:5724 stop:6338 length:615 start_codon:yes stop_codon:yes gene_type:complete
MPKINSYTTVTPVAGDKVIGTDVLGNPANQTKNFTVGSLATFTSETLSLTKSLTTKITPAEVLAANASPVNVLTAPGANKTHDIVSAYVYIDFNSVAYNALDDITLRMGSIKLFAIEPAALNVGQKTIWSLSTMFNTPLPMSAAAFDPAWRNTSSAKVAEWNTATYPGTNNLEFFINTAAPLAGDSDVYVKVIYRVLNTTVADF